MLFSELSTEKKEELKQRLSDMTDAAINSILEIVQPIPIPDELKRAIVNTILVSTTDPSVTQELFNSRMDVARIAVAVSLEDPSHTGAVLLLIATACYSELESLNEQIDELILEYALEDFTKENDDINKESPSFT